MNKLNKKLQDQSGQMVILVMLVLVVALTIGLSLLSRTIQNQRLSTNTDRSNRAYSAAEAGIEQMLTGNQPSSINGDLGLGTTSEAKYKTTSTSLGNNSNPFVFPNPLSKDETVQLWLFNYSELRAELARAENDGTPPRNPLFLSVSCPGVTPGSNYFNECASNGRKLTIAWGSNSLPVSDTSPALEVTFISVENSSPYNFVVEKCAYDPYPVRAANNKFSNPNTSTNTPLCDQPLPNDGPVTTGSFPVGDKTYSFKKTITLPVAGSSRRYLLMRMKLLYNDSSKHELVVDPNGSTLPSQGTIIESEGNSGEVVRKIRVYQSFPTLPGIFDFVVFNGSSSKPLQK